MSNSGSVGILSATWLKSIIWVHTDAIKANLIPPQLTAGQKTIICASEADILNVALFGMTAKEWRERNPGSIGNIRDYADISQLVCLTLNV